MTLYLAIRSLGRRDTWHWVIHFKGNMFITALSSSSLNYSWIPCTIILRKCQTIPVHFRHVFILWIIQDRTIISMNETANPPPRKHTSRWLLLHGSVLIKKTICILWLQNKQKSITEYFCKNYLGWQNIG